MKTTKLVSKPVIFKNQICELGVTAKLLVCLLNFETLSTVENFSHLAQVFFSNPPSKMLWRAMILARMQISSSARQVYVSHVLLTKLQFSRETLSVQCVSRDVQQTCKFRVLEFAKEILLVLFSPIMLKSRARRQTRYLIQQRWVTICVRHGS